VKVRWFLIVLLAAALAPSLAAATIVNGGFESPVCSDVCPGAPDSWTTFKGSVEVVGPNLWDAFEGLNTVDLDGTAWGGISQDITTAANASYRVSFYLAGNFFGLPTVKQLRVSGAGSYEDYLFNTTGKSATNMGWVTHTFDFTASSTTTTLTFESMDTEGGAWGPVIDNVSIADLTGVPEPSTGALAGLALAVLLWTRRR
jgi:choice-of-anchor C domain-containing protein